jgi:hypothetical protein
MDEDRRPRIEHDSRVAEAAHAVADAGSRAVILVEGDSDRNALETLARRRGRDLAAERVSILPIGGATNAGHFLQLLGPHGFDLRLAGLCDVGEVGAFRRGLERAGVGSKLTRADMESLGFFVCIIDLEDELIRAIGATGVTRIMDAQGELSSFRIFQGQPAQRSRSVEQQLRRFMGTRSGRKARYGHLLAAAMDLDLVPSPLDLVLEHVLE